MKKINKKFKQFHLVIVTMLLIFGLVAVTFAGSSFLELVAKYAGESYANKLPVPSIDTFELGEDNEDFGAIATSTVDWSAQPNIAIDGSYKGGGLRFDMGVRTKDGIIFGYENGDFVSATTTIFSVKNTTGETVYVTNGFLKLSGLATSTTQLFVGTSTDGYINNATYQAVTDPSDSITSIMDNILVTDGSVLDATSTVFSLLDFPGSDTGSGNYGVPILAGEYLVGYASTTDADGDGAEITSGYFDGSYWLEYMMID